MCNHNLCTTNLTDIKKHSSECFFCFDNSDIIKVYLSPKIKGYYNMHWLIQSGLLDHTLHAIKKALDHTKSEYTFCGFTVEGHFTGLNYDDFKKHEKFISMSYIKALRYTTTGVTSREYLTDSAHLSDDEIQNVLKKIEDSYFYKNPDNFDQSKTLHLNLPFLNSEALFVPIVDNMELTFSEPKFVKPSTDAKAFNGGILDVGVSLRDFILTMPRQDYWDKEIALISPLQDIHSEYRFFVYKDEVITGSRYILNKIVDVSEVIPKDVYDAAERYAKLFHPDEVYTLDIALMSNGEYKIVEYNAFNCSGVYLADLNKLFARLNEIYQ